MIGQTTLNNVLTSIRFTNPALADQLQPDFVTVALYGLSADKEDGKEAADRLRRAAFKLPAIQARVLEHALTDLGF